jgi:CheY-like chemotaxis protein
VNIPFNLKSNMAEVPQLPDPQQPILIADADDENSSHLERQLRRAGVKNPVISFHNGDDLHAFLADAATHDNPAPCILFLDPRMPGANGYDPVRWVRREKCGSEILVAIFSSNEAADEVEVASELGVTLFLKKHADLGSLSAVVEHVCGPQSAEASALPESPVAPVK